jgi:hypothetical protein
VLVAAGALAAAGVVVAGPDGLGAEVEELARAGVPWAAVVLCRAAGSGRREPPPVASATTTATSSAQPPSSAAAARRWRLTRASPALVGT